MSEGVSNAPVTSFAVWNAPGVQVPVAEITARQSFCSVAVLTSTRPPGAVYVIASAILFSKIRRAAHGLA